MTVARPSVVRRTQAERSAATRARIVDAAIATVAADGFSGANLQAIADRAEVTVGAIQHQFSDKAGVLIAVIDHGLDQLVTELAANPVTASGLEERVREFIGQVWEGYGGPFYGAAIEILLGMRADPRFAVQAGHAMTAVIDRIEDLWMGTFSDLSIDLEAHLAAQRLTFDTLNGMALERILMPGLPYEAVVLESLAAAVTQLLSNGDAS